MTRTIILAFTFLMLSIRSYAQFTINGKNIVYDKISNTYLVTIPEECFGKDYQAQIAITNDSNWTNVSINGKTIDTEYIFEEVTANKNYNIKATKDNEEIEAKLTFTFLPILALQGDYGYDYAQGNLQLYTPTVSTPINTIIKAKWRGGSTNGEDRHKRNYKIKTLNAKGKSQDISFLGMREDNNWILDAGQVDLFRLRNRIATELWNDFATKPYYADKEPKAKSGVDGRVVEVILNNEYRGIYSLTETMDRKEMKLKKYDEKKQEFHGQLWKSESWSISQFWNVPNDYDNNSEKWHSFEVKYPDIEDVCPTDYSTIYNAASFVAYSSDQKFEQEVANYFDLPVLIDYHIFLEITKAFDNTGKNLFWAVYDKAKDKKMTLSVWDLDATMGQYYEDGQELHPENVHADHDLELRNWFNLYSRLIYNNINDYNKKVIDRYWSLRTSYLDETNLINRYKYYYQILSSSGAVLREENRWSGDSDIGGYSLNFKKEIDYISTWIHNRLRFLDQLYSKETTDINYMNKQLANKEYPLYNITGQKVTKSYKGIIIKNRKKIFVQKQ